MMTMFVLEVLAGSTVVAVGFLLPSISKRISSKHRHGPWTVLGVKTFPPQGITRAKYRGEIPQEMRDLIYGYSLITERCDGEDCQLVRTRTVTGEVEIPTAVRA